MSIPRICTLSCFEFRRRLAAVPQRLPQHSVSITTVRGLCINYLHSPDNFAKLFRPKSALYNKVLELIIEDIQYVSFPCPCADELSADVHGAIDVITLFNVVVAVVRESAMRRVLGYEDSQNSEVKRLFSKKLKEPGCDPVATAMGLRGEIHPISSSMMRR